MTIREFIQKETDGATTQVEFDQIWAAGFPQKIRTAFPDVSASEIMYEWDIAKSQIRKMV